MKRLLSVLLSFSMLFLLVACSGESVSADTTIENSGWMPDDDHYQFLYDLNINKDWWDRQTDSGKTNRELFDEGWESHIGSTSGALMIRPVDFTIGIKINDSGYRLSVQENHFLIPQHIRAIDDNLESTSSELTFFVVGSDCGYEAVKLLVYEKPEDVEMPAGEWTLVEDENEIWYGVECYYPIDDTYCLKLSLPYTVSDMGWAVSDLDERLAYEQAYPYTTDDVVELANKVTSMMSLTPMTDISVGSVDLEIDDISLDDHITLLCGTNDIVSWHSGIASLFGSDYANNSVITFPYNDEWRYVTAYTGGKDIDAYLSQYGCVRKKDKWNGHTVYLEYIGDASDLSEYIGMYTGVAFEADGVWYDVTTYVPVDVDDVNQYITDLFDGILDWH